MASVGCFGVSIFLRKYFQFVSNIFPFKCLCLFLCYGSYKIKAITQIDAEPFSVSLFA